MSQYDLPGLFQFLSGTPEQGLRKMLIDPKVFSDAHFNLLIKILRTGDEASFCTHADKADFPKIKLGPAEVKIKEKFWNDLFAICKSRGLLNPAQKVAA